MIQTEMRFAAAALVAGALLFACNPGDAPPSGASAADPALPEGHPTIPQGDQAAGGMSGIVMETMNAAGYTYARIDFGERELWVAGPPTALSPGERVMVPELMSMGEFRSESLDRTFADMYFTSAFSKAPPPMSELQGSGTVTQVIAAEAYTYLEVSRDGTTIWVAAPRMQVAVGDAVTWTGGMVMRDFASTTMDRTFEEILFVENVTVVR